MMCQQAEKRLLRYNSTPVGLKGNWLKAGMLTDVGRLVGEVIRPKCHGYTSGKNIN